MGSGASKGSNDAAYLKYIEKLNSNEDLTVNHNATLVPTQSDDAPSSVGVQQVGAATPPLQTQEDTQAHQLQKQREQLEGTG